MRRNSGSALLTTLILLVAIGIMLSAIIYITRQYAKTADAINYGDILRQSAYIAMLDNENSLVRMTKVQRISNINNISQIGVPSSKLTWVKGTYPDDQIKYYAYAKGYVGYIPNDVSMFSANGSYIYSLFAKTAREVVDKGFVYHESFWLNPSVVTVKNIQKIQVKIPNIDVTHLSHDELESYVLALDKFKKGITAEIKNGKIYISSTHRNGNFDLSGLCSSPEDCLLSSGWVDDGRSWSWVVAVYSTKGIEIWRSDGESVKIDAFEPDLSIIFDNSEEDVSNGKRDKGKEKSKNDAHNKNGKSNSEGNRKYGHNVKICKNNGFDITLSSNLSFIRVNNSSYVVYIEKTKEKTQLVMRDIKDGELSNKANFDVSSVGKDKFWLTIIDKDSDLSADTILVFGDKGKFGTINITGSNFGNMSQKITLGLTDLVQPLIISPVDMYGNQFWVTAVTADSVITYLSDNSRFTNINKIWQEDIDNIKRALVYGGLLFIQDSENDILVLQSNNGEKFTKFNSAGSDFSIKSDFENKVMLLSSSSGTEKISNRKILFMREGLKQAILP